MERLIKKIKKEDGQVFVLAGLLMAVVLGFTALAIDVGMVAYTKGKLQNIADAAALAGAHKLPASEGSDPIAEAIKYANLNKGSNWGLFEEGVNIEFDETNEDPNKIEVKCSKIVSYTFARILGPTFKEANVEARAVAIKTNQWNGEALPFVNMADNYINAGDSIDVWGTENVAPGNKERIHDDVVDVPSDYSIEITIQKDSNGPYILMKGGVAPADKIPTPLSNIVKEGNTIYVFSLKNSLIDEKLSYAEKIKNINGYHIPMSDLVLLKCTVVQNWSKSTKKVYLKYQEAYNWDAVKETFIITDGKIALEK